MHVFNKVKNVDEKNGKNVETRGKNRIQNIKKTINIINIMPINIMLQYKKTAYSRPLGTIQQATDLFIV